MEDSTKKRADSQTLEIGSMLYYGGERGIRTLEGSFPPYSLSRQILYDFSKSILRNNILRFIHLLISKDLYESQES